jgi:chromosomal replication initiator protein
MEELFTVNSSHDLKTELTNRYKAARQRIDMAHVQLRYKKIEEEKENQRSKEIEERNKHERAKKKLEDEIIRKYKIRRDYLIISSSGIQAEDMAPKQLEEEIEFWKEASKYIRGQSIPDAIRRIVAEVCLKHKQFLLDIESDRRTTDIIPARHELMYRLRTETTWSLPRIGRFLGNRDHTTVLHGYQKFKKQLEKGEVSL